MIQRGEAVALTGLFHMRELLGVETEAIDIAPVVGGGIHGETGRDRAVGADNHVVLAGATRRDAADEGDLRIPPGLRRFPGVVG